MRERTRLESQITAVRQLSGGLDDNLELIEMGFYISFSGNLTFKNSHLPEVAKKLPLDRLLVETDSPFLSPVPFRGKTNEPGRTRYVVGKLAEISGAGKLTPP